MAKEEKPKSGAMQLVLGLLLTTIVSVGLGFGLSKTLAGPEAAHGSGTAFASAATKDSVGVAVEAKPDAKLAGGVSQEAKPSAAAFNVADIRDMELTPFPPITSNIAMPESVWIRLEGVLAIKPNAGVKVADVAQIASTKMVAYVRTLKLADIQGSVGFQAFNADLNELVRNTTEGQARAVLIYGFIVE